MPSAAGLTVPHSIAPIYVHFFKCIKSFLGNSIRYAALHILNCLWFVVITFSLTAAPLRK